MINLWRQWEKSDYFWPGLGCLWSNLFLFLAFRIAQFKLSWANTFHIKLYYGPPWPPTTSNFHRMYIVQWQPRDGYPSQMPRYHLPSIPDSEMEFSANDGHTNLWPNHLGLHPRYHASMPLKRWLVCPDVGPTLSDTLAFSHLTLRWPPKPLLSPLALCPWSTKETQKCQVRKSRSTSSTL